MRRLSALVVVLFTLACGGLPVGGGGEAPVEGAEAYTASTVVTVLYFDNNTNDPAYDVFGKGLADMMITDLSRVDDLAVVERAKLQALIDEMSLQQSDYFDPATAQKLGQGLRSRAPSVPSRPRCASTSASSMSTAPRSCWPTR